MRKKDRIDYKPFISLTLIILSLFVTLFFTMEVRRKGYEVLKQGRLYSKMQDQFKLKQLKYTEYLSLASLTKKAELQLALQQASKEQVVYISGQNIAIR